MGGSVEAWRASLISSRERSAFSLLIAFHAISPTAFSWWLLLWSLLLLSVPASRLFSLLHQWHYKTNPSLFRQCRLTVWSAQTYLFLSSCEGKKSERKKTGNLSSCCRTAVLKNYDSKQMCNSRKINRQTCKSSPKVDQSSQKRCCQQGSSTWEKSSQKWALQLREQQRLLK